MKQNGHTFVSKLPKSAWSAADPCAKTTEPPHIDTAGCSTAISMQQAPSSSRQIVESYQFFVTMSDPIQSLIRSFTMQHRRMTRHAVFARLISSATLAAALSPLSLSGQSATIAKGTYTYDESGSWNGQMSSSWGGVRETRDTVIGGKQTVLTVHRARLKGDGSYIYNAWLLWTPNDLSTIKMKHQGDDQDYPSECDLQLEAGRLRIKLAGQPEQMTEVSTPIIPDFALPDVVRMQKLVDLKDGDAFKYRVVRCEGEVRYFDYSAVVTSGTMQRDANSPAEAVWVVTGQGEYGLTMFIAKSDRVLLKSELQYLEVVETRVLKNKQR